MEPCLDLGVWGVCVGGYYVYTPDQALTLYEVDYYSHGSLGAGEQQFNDTHLSCFNDDPNNTVFGDYITSWEGSPRDCSARARAGGFAYYGLKSGGYCVLSRNVTELAVLTPKEEADDFEDEDLEDIGLGGGEAEAIDESQLGPLPEVRHQGTAAVQVRPLWSAAAAAAAAAAATH
ncbi:hypothetical protein HYH02_011059 [Chlamydomonas schloesseri]|uniref:Uncharacterized protein n=1 Tax=Chlamydomonas schloesseri TaxID=2026947 RepID=A0A835W389_9CHLO|nr:hypothetical protein HYH02_011059 [Chlamydomonas schloesseri]|eukprot:KAG2437680.1 hypothetical protein HYH02_011059 [Chlamydomonas schloesseri]